VVNCPRQLPSPTTSTTAPPEPLNGTWPSPYDHPDLGPNDTLPRPPSNPDTPAPPSEGAEEDDWEYLGFLFLLGILYCLYRIWRQRRGRPVRSAPSFPVALPFNARPRRSDVPVAYCRRPLRRSSAPGDSATPSRTWDLPTVSLLPIPEATSGQISAPASVDLGPDSCSALDLLPALIEPKLEDEDPAGLPGCSWEEDDVFGPSPGSPEVGVMSEPPFGGAVYP
jgi:hypothetical protein